MMRPKEKMTQFKKLMVDDSWGATFWRVNAAIVGLLGLGLAIGFRLGQRALAGAFLLGGFVSAVSFYLLWRGVSLFTQMAAEGRGKPPAKARYSWFFLRYLLFGFILYVIFKSSAVSAYGLFAGLFLPVAAMLLEAAYRLVAP